MEKLKILCSEWLHRNFGIAAEVTKITIFGKENQIDREYDLIGVAFEFLSLDGKTGDSAVFFDKNIMEEALVKSTFEERFTTESAQVWM